MTTLIRWTISGKALYNNSSITEASTLSLHDALPISEQWVADPVVQPVRVRTPARRRRPGQGLRSRWAGGAPSGTAPPRDRKSTRLNSSHQIISYAVFCLKKKIDAVFRVLYHLLSAGP